jgi:hypothetical protein
MAKKPMNTVDINNVRFGIEFMVSKLELLFITFNWAGNIGW